MKTTGRRLAAFAVIFGLVAALDASAGSWPRRHGNAQNTGNVGDDPALTPETVRDLKVTATIPIPGIVNATPIVSDDLLFVGDSTNTFHVIDLETKSPLLSLRVGDVLPRGTTYSYAGIQSTASIATVTVTDGEETREEKRVYIGGYSATTTFWCLSVDRILADRDLLRAGGGDPAGYVCPNFPIPLAGPGSTSPTFHGTALFSRDQPIRVGDAEEVRDVLYVPSTGLDCANGVLFAVDAASGEKIGMWDPVVATDGLGGVIWFSPAMSRDGSHLYVTTGDCIQKPQAGELAESLVALDPRDIGNGPVWAHQRRLVDTLDVDIGNGPTVVDVEGPGGCRVVVNPDKDGCLYGFRQERDVPGIGAPGFDPLRIGQQRVLWRQCFVIGGIHGGFNAMAATAHDRYVFAQASGSGRYNVTINVGTDNAHAFLVDACSGEFQWAAAAVGWGMGEAAVASGMIFQPGGRDGKSIPDGSDLQVFRAGASYELLATVPLPSPATFGGGGPSIVDGRVYVPLREGGVAIVEVVPGSQAALPQDVATSFGGPYPTPLWWGYDWAVDPDDPY